MAWKARDPLELSATAIVDAGIAARQELEQLREQAAMAVDQAVSRARDAAAPDLEEAYAHVLVG
jgi:TPP-dependent pyruvate/acetoin dehydrogenase alpha subunit